MTARKIKLMPTRVLVWPHWCPVCKAASPQTTAGYLCDKCARTVCPNCIYRYGRGFVCGICARTVPAPEWLQPLNLNVAR